MNKNLQNKERLKDRFIGEYQIGNNGHSNKNPIKNNEYIREFLDDIILKKDDLNSMNNRLNIKSDSFLSVQEMTVTFNIGPSFIHLNSVNHFTGRKFNYLFNSYNRINNRQPIINRTTTERITDKHCNKNRLNNPRTNTIIKLNVYRNNCLCENCLIDTYLLLGNQSIELYLELLNVLNMDCCKAWDLEWVRILTEQLNIFFSCYKDGIFYERLLESASICAKLLLVKNCKYDLLEFKYSYYQFYNSLFNSNTSIVQNNNNKNNDSNSSHSHKISTKFITTGKEELECIDGIAFLTFKTEKDMAEYTNLETNYWNRLKIIDHNTPIVINNTNNNNNNDDDDDNEIIPTKTTDITKIKGWRNKLFTSYNKSVKTNNSNNKNNDDNNELTKQILEKMAENFLNNQLPEEDNMSVIAKLQDMGVKCEKDKTDVANPKEEKLVVTKVEVQEDIPSEDITGKLFDCKVKNSVFESDALDEFLKNNSTLNISYEIPTLHAAEKLKHRQSPPTVSQTIVNTSLQRNNVNCESSPLDVDCEVNLKQIGLVKSPEAVQDRHDFEEITIKHENLEKIQELSPKLTRAAHRNSQNSNPRYIWVQGRPIQVVNGIKDDDMITKSARNLKLPQVAAKSSVKRSKESQTDFQNQDLKENVQLIHDFSLDHEDMFEVDIKRPRLLTNVADSENDCIPREFEAPNNFLPSLIPVLHNCTKLNTYLCNCRQFSLGMILTIGRRRYLSKIAADNLALLNGNDKVISERMATIAASAVFTTQKSILTRIVVPVVSKEIVNAVKNWDQKLAYDRLAQTIPMSNSREDVDPQVTDVVNKILDYVEEKLAFKDIPYDPLYLPKTTESPKKIKKEKQPKSNSKIVRELRRLINVSIIDESDTNSVKVETRSCCGNEYCIKGCICNSLNNKMQFPLHCGRIACMFDCKCNNREVYENNVLKADQLSDIVLAKEEMTWHQTIIRSEDRVEIMNTVDKSKREKKLPTRFRNNVLLGREMCPTGTPSEAAEQETALPEPQPKCDSKSYTNFRGESIKKQIIKRRLAFCADMIKHRRTLADVFIWCGIHDKYNCLCVSWICRLKNNAFIWRPEKTTRYLPHKLMTGMMLNPEYSNEVYLYDTKRFSARTYGTPIEYNVRNRSETFLAKRKCELENNVLSCTNSYIKMKLFMVKDKFGRKERKPLSEFDKKEVYKSNTVENVYIQVEDDSTEDIDIEDHLPPEPAVPIKVEPDTESDPEDANGHKWPEGITMKHEPSKLEPTNELVLQIHSEDDKKEVRKSIRVPAQTIKSVLKQPMIKSYSRNSKVERSVSPVEHQSRKSDIHDKRRLSQGDSETPKITDNMSDTSDQFEKAIFKKKRLSCRSKASKDKEVNVVPSHLPFKDKIDTELEGDLIRLEEHQLKDEMYGSDGLPKLALLCLTPGIGYLPIVEFKQDVLAVQDPVFPELYHSFRNLETANLWLNRFFKNRLIFETIDTSLKWVIVKPGIIKLKRSPPFSPALLENPSIVVTRDGGLIFKKKDFNTGGICRGAIKVEPLSLSGKSQLAVTVKEDKRRVPTEKIVDICDSDGKRRKIQLETLPVHQQIVKRPINLFRQYPSLKLQETAAINQLASQGVTITQTVATTGQHSAGTPSFLQSNSLCSNSGAVVRLNVDNLDKKCSTLQINGAAPVIKSTIRPLFTNKGVCMSNQTSGPIRLQVTPTGLTNLSPRTILPSRSMSPPPLAIRSDVVQQSPAMISGVPFSGSKIISHDGRPVIIHNNTIIPINFKTHHCNKPKQKMP
ncbi:uncharacterized protein isoform X2 [Rhodnius prolixus]